MRLPPVIPNLPKTGMLGIPFSRLVHIALLFVCHFFLGTFVAAWAGYQYEQSRWLAALSQEQSKELLAVRETLLAATSPARSTPDALQRDVKRLETLRGRVPRDARAILTLRIAGNRALLARRYKEANEVAAAEAQSQAARSLLRELGWRDTSDVVLGALADHSLNTISARDVR